MKVIFLDFDGVLNIIPKSYDQFGGTFHDEFVENLKSIIDQTGAKIVVSSTWRLSGISFLRDMWKFRNYPREIIGTTPDTNFTRGHEIQMWLDRNPDVENYVILDDDNDMLDSQIPNFVKTSENFDHMDCVDIGYGLTKICTDKAIKILKK